MKTETQIIIDISKSEFEFLSQISNMLDSSDNEIQSLAVSMFKSSDIYRRMKPQSLWMSYRYSDKGKINIKSTFKAYKGKYWVYGIQSVIYKLQFSHNFIRYE